MAAIQFAGLGVVLKTTQDQWDPATLVVPRSVISLRDSACKSLALHLNNENTIIAWDDQSSDTAIDLCEDSKDEDGLPWLIAR
ncbi:MAG: hypothetical protein DMF61_18920 [Blastocatellia bacterium AA13]|nr:MAG: hypothetical protein DMF61_18920 [Blastocatellia bacterium AA13]